jgi:hypothetical protein
VVGHAVVRIQADEPRLRPRKATFQLRGSLLAVPGGCWLRGCRSELGRSGLATALMLLEQRIEKLFPPPEIRSPEPRERVARSTMPRRAARSRMPSVPVASKPLSRAADAPLRSSMRIRSAATDNPSAIAAFSPSSNARNDGSLPALTTDT